MSNCRPRGKGSSTTSATQLTRATTKRPLAGPFLGGGLRDLRPQLDLAPESLGPAGRAPGEVDRPPPIEHPGALLSSARHGGISRVPAARPAVSARPPP